MHLYLGGNKERWVFSISLDLRLCLFFVSLFVCQVCLSHRSSPGEIVEHRLTCTRVRARAHIRMSSLASRGLVALISLRLISKYCNEDDEERKTNEKYENEEKKRFKMIVRTVIRVGDKKKSHLEYVCGIYSIFASSSVLTGRVEGRKKRKIRGWLKKKNAVRRIWSTVCSIQLCIEKKEGSSIALVKFVF